MRGLKNDRSSQELLDGYIINYNFCRKHSVIKSTPAEKTGLEEVKGWKQLIEKSQYQKVKVSNEKGFGVIARWRVENH